MKAVHFYWVLMLLPLLSQAQNKTYPVSPFFKDVLKQYPCYGIPEAEASKHFCELCGKAYVSQTFVSRGIKTLVLYTEMNCDKAISRFHNNLIISGGIEPCEAKDWHTATSE